jgi:hypothetical protein
MHWMVVSRIAHRSTRTATLPRQRPGPLLVPAGQPCPRVFSSHKSFKIIHYTLFTCSCATCQQFLYHLSDRPPTLPNSIRSTLPPKSFPSRSTPRSLADPSPPRPCLRCSRTDLLLLHCHSDHRHTATPPLCLLERRRRIIGRMTILALRTRGRLGRSWHCRRVLLRGRQRQRTLVSSEWCGTVSQTSVGAVSRLEEEE